MLPELRLREPRPPWIGFPDFRRFELLQFIRNPGFPSGTFPGFGDVRVAHAMTVAGWSGQVDGAEGSW